MPRRSRGRRVLLLLASALPLLATEDDHDHQGGEQHHHQLLQHLQQQHPEHEDLDTRGGEGPLHHHLDDNPRAADRHRYRECVGDGSSSNNNNCGDKNEPSAAPEPFNDSDGRPTSPQSPSNEGDADAPSMIAGRGAGCHDRDVKWKGGEGTYDPAARQEQQENLNDEPRRATSVSSGDVGFENSDRTKDVSRALHTSSEGDAGALGAQQPYSLFRCASSSTATATAATSTVCYQRPYLPPWELAIADPSWCLYEDWGVSCRSDSSFQSVHRMGDDSSGESSDGADGDDHNHNPMCPAWNESSLSGGRRRTPPPPASNGTQELAVPAGSAVNGASNEEASSETTIVTDDDNSNKINSTDPETLDAAPTVHDPSVAASTSAALSSSSTGMVVDERFVNAVDYASKSAGGLVIDKSPNFHGTSNLLTSDRDRYAIVECQEPTKWVVIGLSEDILVKRVGISMFERYSSHVKDFSLLVSTTGTEAWRELGNFTAARAHGEQTFDMAVPMWARYVKIQILSHYGQEHYCTVSQIKVHGSTVLQGFHEQWQETDSGGGEGAADTTAQVQAGDSTAAHLTGGQERGGNLPPKEVDEGNASMVNATTTQSLSEVSTENSTKPAAAADSGDAQRTHSPLSEGFHSLVIAWPASVSESLTCLPAASTLTASGQFADAKRSLDAIQDSLYWKSTPLRLSGSTKPVNNGFPFGFDDPIRPSSATSPNSVAISQSTSPDVSLNRLVQSAFSKLGWSIRFEGLSGMSQFVRSRVDGAERCNDVHDAAANSDTKSDDYVPSDLASDHPDSTESAWEGRVPEPESTSTEGRGGGIGLSHLLERYPSASCLAKVEANLARVSQIRRGGGSGQGNLAGAQPGAGMEPVFKKLTDEIKALQASLAVHEDLSRESVSCFQDVLVDVFADMILQRQIQDRRLDRLEHDYIGSGWVMAMWSHWLFLMSLLLRRFDSSSISGLGTGRWRFSSTGFTLVIVALTVLRACRRRRRSTKTSECTISSSSAFAAPDFSNQAQLKPKAVAVSPTPDSTPDVSPLK